MRKRMATLRFLIDRRTAGRFAELTNRMKPAQIGLHFQSVLAASIVNPTAVLTRLVGDGFLDRQVSIFRPNQKPVLLELRCEDVEQRDAIRRLLTALTAELTNQLAGPVMPDASTVVRALVAEWVEFTVLNRSGNAARARQPVALESRRPTHTPQSERRSATTTVVPHKRRRKERKPSRRKSIDPNKPHPDFPDVCWKPIAWRPKRRGRPPKDALRNGRGEWLPPPGWRIIRNRWHQPVASDAPSEDVAQGGTGGEAIDAIPPTTPTPPPVNAPLGTAVAAAGHSPPVPEGSPAPLSAIPDGEVAPMHHSGSG